MKSTEIKVKDPSEVAKIMDGLGEEWNKIVSDALTSALGHSLQTKVKQRVPKSNAHVHPEYRDPNHPFYHPSAGAQNLAKDFDIALIRVSDGDVSAKVGFEHVEYAQRVHDMPDPHPNGQPVRWSTPGTGNRYLDEPVAETVDMVLEDMDKNIVAKVERLRA